MPIETNRFFSILPSGRAVRGNRPSLKIYRDVKERLGDRGSVQNVAEEMIPRLLTGITAAPVPEILGDPEKDAEGNVLGLDGKPVKDGAPPLRYLNIQAMCESVDQGAAGGWIELNYERLRQKDDPAGPSFFDQLFEYHIDDYTELTGLVLNAAFSGGAKLPPPARRLGR